MKKLFSITLVLALLLALSVPAFAEEAKFQNTQGFLKDVDGYTDLKTELIGVINFGGENYEQVKVSYKGSASNYTSNFSVLFNEDEGDVVLYMNPLVTFEESKLNEVMTAVNNINSGTTGLKIYVDTSDNTVSAELYLLVTKDSAVELTETGVGFLIGFTDTVYERLSEFKAN